MTKDEKKKQAEALRAQLAKSHVVFLSAFEGLTVAQDTDLRRKIGEAGGCYQVVKNTVIRWAAQGTPAEPLATNLRGTTSVAYTEQADAARLAKVITAYAKENPALVFKTGLVEGRVISLGDLGAIATLPSREELLARSLFVIKSAAQRVVSGISSVARNLVYVVQQAVEEKKFQESPGN